VGRSRTDLHGGWGPAEQEEPGRQQTAHQGMHPLRRHAARPWRSGAPTNCEHEAAGATFTFDWGGEEQYLQQACPVRMPAAHPHRLEMEAIATHGLG